MSLATVEAPKKTKPEPLPPGERSERVFLPPPQVLRQLVPLAPAAAIPRPMPTPPPPPTPADAGKKDRISIGGPSQPAKGPLVLKRDEEIQAPKGRPDAAQPTPTPAPESLAQPNDLRRPGTPPIESP